MRWSRASALFVLLAASGSATAQSVQGAPTEGAQSVPVIDGASATPNVPRQGVPSSVLSGAESVPVTYNDGLYTPWTPTSEAVATQASVQETQATVQALVTASPASSIYLQPTTAASPAVTISTLSTDTAESSEASTEASTSTASSSTSSSTSSPVSTSSSSSSISFASRTTRSTSTLASATSVNDKADISSGPHGQMMTVLPVVLSLGVLALLMGILLFFVWRRRQRKRRMLESRRYNDDDAEKASFRYPGGAHEDDEYMEDEEKGPGSWTTFQQTPLYDDAEKGSGMAGLGSAASPVYRMNEQRESSERGWQWGAAQPNNVLRQSRGPLPSTPQAASTDLQRAETLESLHADLDAMIAESRTGYEPRQASEDTGGALGRTASAIYSSLSGRGKRFGSRASSRSAYSSGPGSWNEHGVWELETDLDNSDVKKKRASSMQDRSDDERGQGRPLLACVDETPRKKGYSTYTPPESPSRNSGRDYADDDTAMTVAGGSSMQYSFSDGATAPLRRVTLRDNPVPAFSPSTAGGATPRRWRSKTLSQSDCDSPSLYSPSTNGHGAFSPPTALQPGRSPALGSRPASPAIQTHPYYKAYNQPSNAPLTQSTKSGTTYSLSGMAGLLYNKDATPNDASYTDLPPRKPRRKSTLAKTRPDIPGVTVTPASSADTHNPHRAVSRVIQQSRARGSSISSQSSGNSAPKQPWDSRIRSELRESTSSGSSIDELLSNVLGSTRSPA